MGGLVARPDPTPDSNHVRERTQARRIDCALASRPLNHFTGSVLSGASRSCLSRCWLRDGIPVAFGQNVAAQAPFDSEKKAALSATCRRLSLAIAILAGVASLVGLFLDGFYRDNA